MMGIILLLCMERSSLIRSKMVLLIKHWSYLFVCWLLLTIDISAANKPSDGGDAALVWVVVFISIKTQTRHGVGERRRVVF